MSSTVVHHWWRFVISQHRLFFRMMRETPNSLSGLPYLDLVIKKIEKEHTAMMRMSYPAVVKEYREHLLSSERHFLSYLRAVKAGYLPQAEVYYNMAAADLSMLQFLFMENGIESYI